MNPIRLNFQQIKIDTDTWTILVVLLSVRTNCAKLISAERFAVKVLLRHLPSEGGSATAAK